MGHPAEGSDRNTALYLIDLRIKELVSQHGVRHAKYACSSVTLPGDLGVTLWDPGKKTGSDARMFYVQDGGHTVLSGWLDHHVPGAPNKNYYAQARVLASTWHRGTWQRRLFEEPVDVPKSSPQKKGPRLVHSNDG